MGPATGIHAPCLVSSIIHSSKEATTLRLQHDASPQGRQVFIDTPKYGRNSLAPEAGTFWNLAGFALCPGLSCLKRPSARHQTAVAQPPTVMPSRRHAPLHVCFAFCLFFFLFVLLRTRSAPDSTPHAIRDDGPGRVADSALCSRHAGLAGSPSEQNEVACMARVEQMLSEKLGVGLRVCTYIYDARLYVSTYICVCGTFATVWPVSVMTSCGCVTQHMQAAGESQRRPNTRSFEETLFSCRWDSHAASKVHNRRSWSGRSLEASVDPFMYSVLYMIPLGQGAS